jgi:hypothetical protein
MLWSCNFIVFVPSIVVGSNCTLVALGGIVVACLPLDPRFGGSNPAKNDGIFKGDKNSYHYFLQMGNKAIGPML